MSGTTSSPWSRGCAAAGCGVGGTRTAVHDVLDYLAAGMKRQEILDDFPYLTEDDIRACLSYAADVLRRDARLRRSVSQE